MSRGQGEISARVEAPVTVKAYLLCAFAAFGGILFGYDSGYISGVLGMNYFKKEFGHPNSTDTENAYEGFMYHTWEKSLITSILSCGTFFGALFAGSLADWIGRRNTVVSGCGVFMLGVILQVASTSVGLLVGGRLIAGIGVGFVSAVIILYMSEIAPKAVRGAIVSGYQFAITIGLLLASCVDQATKDRLDSGSYRIPISIQFAWALILGGGLLMLPESPRYYVKDDKLEQAAHALSRIRGQPVDSEYIQLWNFVLGYITPYMVDANEGNLGAKVFFVWGSTCTLCGLFAYFMVPETKGLSLEQVDRMLEETTPHTSSKWVPHDTFADDSARKEIAKVTGASADVYENVEPKSV
ncbi:putative glucose transporter rco-3 [Lasiodiplodia hormozganensis]|uniref:Glucose transporter rco-3 n=1 Tax=Lasiodiplodia hormozganensis TaxID=869390 RepID=A0AA40BYZ1_9PEZI|nr:putative glucose transporter rco-3 [Lasiodiplodia hormozganensis]